MFNENPIATRLVRYNQSGYLCQKFPSEEKAITKKGAQVECKSDCPHRQSVDNQKPACSEEITFVFMIPSLCKDRAFLIQTRAYNSINQLKEYFDFQKHLGNSIIGHYNLLLVEKETTSRTGITSNHWIYDLVKVEQNETTVQPADTEAITNNETVKIQEPKKSSSNQKEKTNNVVNISETKKTAITKNKAPKKETKPSNDTEMPKKEEPKDTTNNTDKQDKDFVEQNKDKYYVLIETKLQDFKKEGKTVQHLVGNFADMKDNLIEAVIHPDFAEELQTCELGTSVLLDIEEKGTNKIVTKCEYIQKLKKAV